MWRIRKTPREPADMWDEAAQRLIEQGAQPEKVKRATRLIKHIVREGGLSELDPAAAKTGGLIDVEKR